MHDTVVRKGTGRKARVKGIELAGKTGTTNDNIDAWFCGFSPTIQTVVCFGKDNNPPMRSVRRWRNYSRTSFCKLL
ncbi:MAG: hypothetical protein ACNI22_04970 [Halarcobacter sp.]